MAQQPATTPKGDAALATVTVTATVAKIDHKTRAVTLKAANGQEYSFVADEAVKNLAQVKKGDVVTATYAEALAYELKKGGSATGAVVTAAGGAAQPGEKPGAAAGRKVTATVAITAIDLKAPSVTFKSASGETRTAKVQSPAKLAGVKVGDTVEVTYAEALAVKVEPAPKKK
jgi:Cu/Ag efflux protein CusF